MGGGPSLLRHGLQHLLGTLCGKGKVLSPVALSPPCEAGCWVGTLTPCPSN